MFSNGVTARRIYTPSLQSTYIIQSVKLSLMIVIELGRRVRFRLVQFPEIYEQFLCALQFLISSCFIFFISINQIFRKINNNKNKLVQITHPVIFYVRAILESRIYAKHFVHII